MISTIDGLVHISSAHTNVRLDLNKIYSMYIDWVNNFISPYAFANWYGITYEQAILIIEQGRKISEAFSDLHKALKN